MKRAVKTPIGKIYPERTAFLHTHIGTVTTVGPGILKYTMATTLGGNPLIRSRQTGKCFSLSWQDIVDLAVRAGIDDE